VPAWSATGAWRARDDRYVLKNLTRDWGAEGAPERSQSYGRIAAEVAARLGPPPARGAAPPRVLVPGAGLGRLCCDLAALGYEAQARPPIWKQRGKPRIIS